MTANVRCDTYWICFERESLLFGRSVGFVVRNHRQALCIRAVGDKYPALRVLPLHKGPCLGKTVSTSQVAPSAQEISHGFGLR